MAVNLSPVGGVAGQFFDNNGNPLTGGKLYTYAAGTTTPQATYTSAAGVIAHSNPIILNAGGRVPNEIWLTDGLEYKFALYDANNVLIGTWDDIIGINSNFVNFVSSEEVQIATAGQTVFTLTTMQYQPGTNNLVVYVDGVNQVEGGSYSYVETNSTTVTFTSGLHVGAVVKFVSAETLSTNVTSASSTTFTGFNSQVGVVQDIADADGSDWIGFEPDGTGAVARSVETKLRETVSVKDFGAIGDGVADDTVAIQAAYDYIAERHGILHFPLGNYICSGIDLGSGNKSCTFQGDSYDGKGAIGNISQITLKNNSNRSLFTILNENSYRHSFNRLVLNGNKSNQTTPAYLIHVSDNPPGGDYRMGVQIENVHFVNGSGGGLYIGANRGSNTLRQVYLFGCGTLPTHHGIHVNVYDTVMIDCHLGDSSGYNLYLTEGAQLQFYAVNCYKGGEGGVYVGPKVNQLAYFGGSIDRNQKNGLYIEKRTDLNWPGTRVFNGLLFLGNSSSANNTYSDVYFKGDDTETVFVGCNWQGNVAGTSVYPKYFIYYDNAAAKTKLLACRVDTDEPGYATDLTNNYSSLQTNDLLGFGFQMLTNDILSFKAGTTNALQFKKSTGQLSVGGSTFDGVSFRQNKSLTGATTARSVLSDPVIQSDVTANAYYFASSAKTTAAAFNLTTLTHYYANLETLGAGSSVTSQFGFHAENTIVGATNNYGFYSNIPSGTGRWNFYANGAAPNYFGGSVTWKPSAIATPANNGDLTFEATSNISVTVKLRGTDGVVRSAVLTLT